MKLAKGSSISPYKTVYKAETIENFDLLHAIRLKSNCYESEKFFFEFTDTTISIPRFNGHSFLTFEDRELFKG